MTSPFDIWKAKAPDLVKKDNDSVQGSYTDGYFRTNPLHLRSRVFGWSAAEKAACGWIVGKYRDKNPSWSVTDCIDQGLADGWFYLGEHGELHVAQQEPKNEI